MVGKRVKKILAGLLSAVMLMPQVGSFHVKAAEPYAAVDSLQMVDVKTELDKYNVVVDEPVKDSVGSVPIGNGDITANVWVEENGDLCFYIGKSDTWSEAGRLLKLGKVRAKITPSPFTSGNEFAQVLKLNEGELLITGGEAEKQVNLRVWVDANHPVIRVEAYGDYEFDMEVSTEIWRDEVVVRDPSIRHSFYGFADSPDFNPEESADRLLAEEDTVIWYHRNEYSYYDELIEEQHMTDVLEGTDPYIGRTFGACIKGKHLVSTDDQAVLCSENASQRMEFAVYPYIAQTDTLDEWENGLLKQVEEVENVDRDSAYEEHLKWWQDFWNRSYVFISGDEAAEAVTQGYIMQRYMQAIQGRGNYPIKFNGGTINFDYNGMNADFRLWGPCFWFQNTRLQYWNMLAAGDYDLMLPLFKMYMDMLNTQMAVTQKYYGHEGAFFPETINFFGLYNGDDFGEGNGWNNPGTESGNPYVRYYWQSGLELSAMMLEYYNYTKDMNFAKDTLIPFAEQVVKFYNNHYERNAEGKLEITPAHVLETYWTDVKNPMEVVSGLECVLSGLLELPVSLVTKEQLGEWSDILGAVPGIPMGSDENGAYLKPAQDYNPYQYSNQENAELYSVFPYKIYGVGREALDTAVYSYEKRRFVGNDCWRYDATDAAMLGLEQEAKNIIVDKFTKIAPGTKFPGFWTMADHIPDLDNGGTSMYALQNMLMQCVEDKIYILPAWPAEWSVNCKLMATDNTTVTIRYQSGEKPEVSTDPVSRQSDLVINIPELPPPPSEAPVAWWNMDEGAGNIVNDISGNHHTGNIVTYNGSAEWTDGKWGNALELKNGAAIKCGKSSLEHTDSMTLSMWVKSSSSNAEYLFSGWYTGGPYIQFTYNVGGVTGGVVNAYTPYTDRISSKTSVTDNQWHHVVWTFEQNQMLKIYVDGQEECSAQCGSIDFSSWEWAIGTEGPNNAGSLNAAVDDVRIYERAISAEEVAKLYTGETEEPGQPVNKELLQKTYDYASALSTDGVVDSAKEFFDKAFIYAKEILDKDNATQEEVDAAWDQLLNGIWGLGIVKGDKTVLKLLIDKANAMMEESDRYVQNLWQQLENALQAADNVMKDGDALKDDVEPVADALLQAIMAQRYKANKENLQDILNQAKGLDLAQYTKESVAAFRAAFKAAEAVMAEEGLSVEEQAKVDQAERELLAAIDGLKLASNDGGNKAYFGNGDKANNAPKTGDGMYMMIWMILVAMTSVTVIAAKRKKED